METKNKTFSSLLFLKKHERILSNTAVPQIQLVTKNPLISSKIGIHFLDDSSFLFLEVRSENVKTTPIYTRKKRNMLRIQVSVWR